MKKVLVFLLSVCMLLGMSVHLSAGDLLISPAPSASPSYTDAAEIPQYGLDAAQWASGQTILLGYPDGALRPNAPCTRAQLACWLYRLAQASEQDVSVGEDTNILSYTDAFDIPEYAFPAFQWACGSGLMTDDGNGALRPNAPCTRAEVLTILYAAAYRQGLDVSVGEDTNILSYTDAFDIPEGSFSALQWACGAGILKGDGNGALLPNDACSRIQVLVFLHRCFAQ